MTERAAYIGRVRALARRVAQAYHDARAALGYPMLRLDGSEPWIGAEEQTEIERLRLAAALPTVAQGTASLL